MLKNPNFVIYRVGSLLVNRCDSEHNLLFQITVTRVDSSPSVKNMLLSGSPGVYRWCGGGRELVNKLNLYRTFVKRLNFLNRLKHYLVDRLQMSHFPMSQVWRDGNCDLRDVGEKAQYRTERRAEQELCEVLALRSDSGGSRHVFLTFSSRVGRASNPENVRVFEYISVSFWFSYTSMKYRA